MLNSNVALLKMESPEGISLDPRDSKPYSNESSEALSNRGMESTLQLTSNVEEDEDRLEPCGGIIGVFYSSLRINVIDSLKSGPVNARLKYFLMILALSAYLIYVFIRWYHSDCAGVDWANGYGVLFIIYSAILVYAIYKFSVKQRFAFLKATADHLMKIKKTLRWAYYCLLLLGAASFLVVSVADAVDEPRRYFSLVGYFGLLVLGFAFSKHPDYVRWDTVCRGVGLHMSLALLIVKWSAGRVFLTVVSDKIIGFLEFSYVGARFVYGDTLVDLGIFLFKGLSVLFFVAMFINILFYYGILQVMFNNLGACMQALIGTTIVESSNSVASVFLGMSESPLLFKPYLPELTASEIHAVMTSGFATVAGTVLAAYVSFGANPTTLVSASAMAAPASLTMAKLFYPETHKTKTSSNNLIIHKSEDVNVVDAACKGAMVASEIVSAIAANVLAFVSMIAFFNSVLSWLGQLAGIKNFSFQGFVGLIFVPLAWAMGVQPHQAFDVAQLIGVKTIINEFVGYQQLGVLVKAGKLSARSEAIATYAMCGFANPGSVAILVSGLVTVCPQKRKIITDVAFRAFVAGSFSSFLSASLAGFITPENGFHSIHYNNLGNASWTNDTSCYFYSW